MKLKFSFEATLPACGLLALCLTQPCAQAQTPIAPLTLPTVEIISTAVLPGLGTPLQDVPANVQVHSGRELTRQRASNIAEFLEYNATSVNINAAQGNPFQPDLSFRGFTASPLLGLPQGLSVFQDGVRINEPFGDVVNWDLLPQSAIASVQLLPGSNPVFGLNTLGGAVSLQTKSGLTHPGGALQVTGGSFGRQAIEFEQGGQSGNWHYFLTGNAHGERGWGEHNASQVRQFFGKLGYVAGKSAIDISLTLADNTLEGSQTLPQSFSNNIRQAYTYPDQNRNRLNFLNIKAKHVLGDALFVDANFYVRNFQNQNVSSNVNAEFDGVTELDQGTNDRSTITQDSYGFGLQFTRPGQWLGLKQQLLVGLSADLGSARYTHEVQEAAFSANRATIATEDYELHTHATAENHYYGLYLKDTVTLSERWTVTLSGRHNLAFVRIADQSGSQPDLNGDHSFARFNPAVGINYNPSSTLTAYAAYNEGMRVPTPIELTCANPAAPCKLPNSFLSDPPLNMVVAKTVELGARGSLGASGKWSAALYRTELTDDIQFISSLGTGSNTGYFQNVGNSLRQGIELSATNHWGGSKVTLRYGYINATYQSDFTATSPANSSADGSGNIHVKSGNRIPGIPQHSLKLRLDHDLSAQWAMGLSVNLSSAIYARGDENNQDRNGAVSGYTLVNWDTRYQVSPGLELFGRINNVFDARYANFATLDANFFTGPNNTLDGTNRLSEQFLGYGAPRGAWVGLRYRWN